MPDGGQIDQHKSITYAETEVMLAPGATFTVLPDTAGRTVTVSGSCPACGGLTATEFPYGIGGTGTKGWVFRGSAGHPTTVHSPVTVYCECGHVHPDRPDSAPDLGCGRFWLVELTLP